MKRALVVGKLRASRPANILFPVAEVSCRRNLSSSAALLEDDEPEIIHHRPRLETLRQKLLQEQDSPIFLSKYPANNIRGKDKKLNDSNLNAKSLDQLIKQLDALPLPQEPLTDRFGRQHSYLRISLAERCNLRCQYCMPKNGVPLQPESHLLSNTEIVRLASWFVENGVTKLRLTGGEPLLRKNLLQLVGNLNELGLEQIGMTTNGVTLSKQLPDLVAAGMSHVNISLDSLQPKKFASLTRRPQSYFIRVMQAIEDCASLLPNQTKINCVVLPDNVDEMQAFCELTSDMPVDIRFIEYMPFNENKWQTNGFVSYHEMKEQIQGLERLQDGPNDTTKWWTLSDGNTQGRIGFITSMSEHFCGTCNRLRITADGQLKVCLFGNTEVSLRDLMRQGGSDETIQKLIHYSVQRKHFKLGGHEDMEDLQLHSSENRPMTLIGG
jgi:cyclic pyranopterin phosphate synthase